MLSFKKCKAKLSFHTWTHVLCKYCVTPHLRLQGTILFHEQQISTESKTWNGTAVSVFWLAPYLSPRGSSWAHVGAVGRYAAPTSPASSNGSVREVPGPVNSATTNIRLLPSAPRTRYRWAADQNSIKVSHVQDIAASCTKETELKKLSAKVSFMPPQ